MYLRLKSLLELSDRFDEHLKPKPGAWETTPYNAHAHAERIAECCDVPATILPDARDIDPPQLPPGSVVYIDPPYVNTTGYAHDLGRDAVCEIAERWASAGAWVVISEAEPLAELGWHQVEITGERVGQKRTFSKQQREYLTMNRPPAWRPSIQSALFSVTA
jgi:16S rRNA G966 N2-methylase RsmD